MHTAARKRAGVVIVDVGLGVVWVVLRLDGIWLGHFNVSHGGACSAEGASNDSVQTHG